MRILLFSILSATLLASVMAKDFERLSEDDGAMATSWLPDDLADQMGNQPTMLLAKYESASGPCYYVINYAKGKKQLAALTTAFFKMGDGKIILLGQSPDTFPFSRYIKDPEIVKELWTDFLARWTRQDGKEGIQEKIDARGNNQITEEEAFYLTQAGFKVPSTAQAVKEYHPKKPKP